MVETFTFLPPRTRRAWSRLLGAGALALALPSLVLAQTPFISTLSPARNATAAAAAADVRLTFSQPIAPATATNVRLQSTRAGGRKAVVATVADATITVNPTVDFKPGEVVHVTVPNTVTSTGGAAASKQVYQFTVAAGPGSALLGGGSEVSVGVGPQAVSLADVDGDGDLDLLTANDGMNGSGSTISLRRNNGDGTFSGGSDFSVGRGPRQVLTADVDGDRDLDLLVLCRLDNIVVVRLNNGAGSFNTSYSVGVGNDPRSLAVADVDADGDLDLLTGNYTAGLSTPGNSVSVRYNNGFGSFSGSAEVSVVSQPVGLVTGDVDNDGDVDLLVGSATGTQVSLRLNNGLGTFTGSTNFAVGANPSDLSLADVDADGDLDLLVITTFGSSVGVWLNNGSGSFTRSSALVSVDSGTDAVTTGDVDGDGDLDIVTSSFDYVPWGGGATKNTVCVRLNDGTGVFSGTSSVPVGPEPLGLAVADVDGDGDLDLLTANHGQGYGSTASVRLNQNFAPTISGVAPGSGMVGTAVTIYGTYLRGARSVRFNGGNGVEATITKNDDQSLEVLVPAGAETGTLSVTTRDGTATSASRFVVLTGPPVQITGLSPQRNHPAAPRMGPVTVTFNQAVTAASAQGLSVWGSRQRGKVAGSLNPASASAATVAFTPSQGFAPGEAVSVSVPATIQTSGEVPVQAQVYQFTAAAGPGPALFSGGSQLALSPNSGYTVPADIDGDGDVDLLTLSEASMGVVNVQLNSSRGTFTAGPDLRVGEYPTSMAVADIDGDGDLDVLTTNGNSTRLTILLNQGGLSFTPGSEATVGYSAYGLMAADFDADGDLDLLMSKPYDKALRLLLNNGQGAFSPGPSTTVNDTYYKLTVADVNGDGNLDVLVPVNSSYLTAVPVWLNNGNGSFHAGASIAVKEAPFRISTADLNGDGSPDLVSMSNNSVSIRLNNGAGQFAGGVDLPAPGGHDVHAADVDGDGDLDLVQAYASGTGSAVRIVPNSGNGSFGTATVVLTGPLVYSLCSADIDGDLDLDLLTVHGQEGKLATHYNQLPNRAPTLTSAAFLVAENAAAGTVVGSVTGADPDTGQTLTYTLTDDPTKAFAVHPATGQLTIAKAHMLDFEQTPTWTLRVQVTDSGSPTLSATTEVRVTLSDALEDGATLTPAEVTVYPNPARGQFTVSLPLVPGSPAIQATLLNSLGQAVGQGQGAYSAVHGQLNMDVATLAAGVYVLRLQVGNASIVKRVVVVR